MTNTNNSQSNNNSNEATLSLLKRLRDDAYQNNYACVACGKNSTVCHAIKANNVSERITSHNNVELPDKGIDVEQKT